ncbi:MAG TPA: M23 family metallopeptidase [Pyrinomonadaceae bacterium]|nr:M23 family metallopeptidase [Pyrinomonadaceae bacterium]
MARISRTSKHGTPHVVTWSRSQAPVASPTAPFPTVQPTPQSIGSSQTNTNPTIPRASLPSPAGLIIPVAGVRPDQLRDTFSESRAQGRIHDAIDIPAPRGTPVIAAADGLVVKLFQSARGGTTIYQLSTDGKFVYYYAHLDRYAEDLTQGHFAKQGETIGYVGDSGNAGAGNYHLHFSIAEISDPKDFWHGVNINPYPLLRK